MGALLKTPADDLTLFKIVEEAGDSIACANAKACVFTVTGESGPV